METVTRPLKMLDTGSVQETYEMVGRIHTSNYRVTGDVIELRRYRSLHASHVMPDVNRNKMDICIYVTSAFMLRVKEA